MYYMDGHGRGRSRTTQMQMEQQASQLIELPSYSLAGVQCSAACSRHACISALCTQYLLLAARLPGRPYLF